MDKDASIDPYQGELDTDADLDPQPVESASNGSASNEQKDRD